MNESGSWSIAPVAYADVHRLAAKLGVSDVMAQVLVRRGFADADAAHAFLHPDYRVHDPYLMAGMSDARRRVDRALQRGEPIAVHGDYDADGITATVSARHGSRGAGRRRALASAQPVRGEGTASRPPPWRNLAAAGVELLITVDCGINARAEVAAAGLGRT